MLKILTKTGLERWVQNTLNGKCSRSLSQVYSRLCRLGLAQCGTEEIGLVVLLAIQLAFLLQIQLSASQLPRPSGDWTSWFLAPVMVESISIPDNKMFNSLLKP